MADFGTSISLYKRQQTSDDSSSEHSPPTLHTLSTGCTSASGSSFSRPSDLTLTVPDHSLPPQNQQTIADAARKPRGRPPGSKNKPKPPVIITRDSDVALKPIVLEISVGSDIIETITSFARRHQVAGFSVLSASGSVSNITLRHPVSHAPAVSLRGPFSILSLTGSVLGSVVSSSDQSGSTTIRPLAPSSQTSESSFGLTIAGAQGQVFGGVVVGNLPAASKVVVVAAIFLSSLYQKVPSETTTSGGGDYVEADHYYHQDGNTTNGAHHGVGALAGVGGESCTNTVSSMSAYGVASPSLLNCQVPASDVMSWCPTSRSPY